MDKLSVDFKKLTRREQLIYAHAKFVDHFKMTSDTISAIESWMERLRIIWLAIIIVCTGWLVVALAQHGLHDWHDVFAAGAVMVTLTAVQCTSFVIMGYTSRMLLVIKNLLSNLADDATLKLSFEELAAQNGTLDSKEATGAATGAETAPLPDAPA